MKISVNPEKCCGCLACKDACGVGAITLCEDEFGFVFPKIDEQFCVNCGKCSRVCAFENNIKNGSEIQKAYAFALTDTKKLKESTSGGAFTALSDIILSEGGMIVGSVLEDDLSVCHILSATSEDRDRMRKSKYVQSSTEGIFNKVNSVLKEGKSVLFTGTPCQCSQMAYFAKENAENLYTCDFLCHGVPAHSFFMEHIKYLEKIFSDKAVSYVFRDKKYGWSHTEGVKFASGKWNYSKKVQSYRKFFYDNVTLRKSCLNCPYRTSKRYADVTIADFWGVSNRLGDKPFPNEAKGVSLVMASTDKGVRLCRKLGNSGNVIEVAKDDIAFKFSGEPTKVALDEKEFRAEYESGGYEGLVKKYIHYSKKNDVIFTVKNWGRKLLRR